MTAITVSGLRISPYTQKDLIPKLVFGDQWGITVKLPTPHQAGDKYALGIDYENTLYPPNRPLCAGTEAFAIDGDELTFNVKLGTARLRDWVSSIRKPMPIAIQIVRIRSNKAETILLDTLLALPSVFDGVVTVCEGDAIQILLDAKLDKPAVEGVAGQILGIDENGQTVWVNEQEIPEQQQADWDESDSGDVTYIKNKPQLAKVATSGSYNDLTDKPTIPEQKQANWDESDSTDPSYIENKPEIPSDANDYLCFTCAPNNDYTISLNKSNASLPDLNMEWSKDKKNWTACTWSGKSGNEVHLDPGESVWYRGNNSSFSTGEEVYYWFRADNHYSVGDFNGVYISGNIMSLLDKTCQLKTIPNNYCFRRLFYYQAGSANQNWLSAPKLPATELKAYCYSGMFRLASKLVEPPELPATNLSTRCYESMFDGCGSLSRAPKLPATELADGCYATMFLDCTSLKFVSVPFTTWNNNTNYWLINVSATGVFECPSALVVTPRGPHSVPTGWTIVRIDAPNPDWDESDSTEASFIRNKPEIGASAQSDWDESDSTEPSYIENKPDIGQMIADALVFHNN